MTVIMRVSVAWFVWLTLAGLAFGQASSAPQLKYKGVTVGQATYLPGTKTVAPAIAHSGCIFVGEDAQKQVGSPAYKVVSAETARKKQQFFMGEISSICSISEGYRDGRYLNRMSRISVNTRASTRSVVAEYTQLYGKPTGMFRSEDGTIVTFWQWEGGMYLGISPQTTVDPQFGESISYTGISLQESK